VGTHILEFREATTHSFIVKIWSEETTAACEKVPWRGHITHVPSGERQYLEHLNDLCLFIVPYLISTNARVGTGWRVMSWFLGKEPKPSTSP